MAMFLGYTMQLGALVFSPHAPICGCMPIFSEHALTARGETIGGIIRNGLVLVVGLTAMLRTRRIA